MNKSFLLLNIRSMNDLPKIERWLIRDHFVESLMQYPALARYISYRVVPPPYEMYSEVEKYGYYNWRVTEHWWHDWSLPLANLMASVYIPDYNEIVGITKEDAHYPTKWQGKLKGPHPPVLGGAPLIPDQDFKGKELTLNDHKSILRWYIVMRYPQGVSQEEGDDWYLNVHSKEVLKQPGLTRYFSSRTVQKPSQPSVGKRASRERNAWAVPVWHRISEQWYEDFDSWKNSIESVNYTKPSWAQYCVYPYFQPYVDFCSTFILEKPTNDNLRDNLAYITI